MKNSTGCYPRVEVDTTGADVVSHAGAVLLVRGAQSVGLDGALSSALGPWTKPLATHRVGKVVLDLAVTLALGGDCLADVAAVRAGPAIHGLVGSDATVSRAVTVLAGDSRTSLRALKKARAAARARAWAVGGDAAPGAGGGPLVIDLDATLVTAHSEKELAKPTFTKGFGFHPLWAFVDHGPDGSGEPLAVLLRPGNAGSNTAADHITVVGEALDQLPAGMKRRRNVLVRTDGAGCTHAFLTWLSAKSRNLGYSVGFNLSTKHVEAIAKIPGSAWTPAYDADGHVRVGAWVADATGVLDLTGWPAEMRVIVGKERPHPGAQLTFTDIDGLRLTAFATNTRGAGPAKQIPDLELRHRQRARAEDRIRVAKNTGLRNLPLHSFAQNEIWLQIVSIACALTAWTQLLAFPTHPARRWEPKTLRFRLFSIAARVVRHARRTVLQLPERHPWTQLLTAGLTRLDNLGAPD